MIKRVAASNSPEPQSTDITKALKRSTAYKEIHFKCSPDLYKRMNLYKIENDTTVTELIITAVENHLKNSH